MPQADEILRNAAAAGPGALDGVVASTNIYLVLYHESLLANLIEIMLFHKESLEALSSDSLLELVDYCHRRLLYLNSGHAKTDTAFVSRSTQDWIAMDKATEFEDKLKDVRADCRPYFPRPCRRAQMSQTMRTRAAFLLFVDGGFA
jgi:hypothetical protein